MAGVLDVEALQADLRQFAAERDWEPFHTPKNLALALVVEAAELAEVFQWLTPDESGDLSGEQRLAVADEIADVVIYLSRLADLVGVDVADAVATKMTANTERFPPSNR